MMVASAVVVGGLVSANGLVKEPEAPPVALLISLRTVVSRLLN
jgi:hypothetical protein